MKVRAIIVWAFAAAMLVSCATTTAPQRFCSDDTLLIDINFEGGNFAGCRIGADGSVSVLIRPEDQPPINESPWYAFRVTSRSRAAANITVTFEDGYPRYWPKLSRDRETWTRADDDSVSRSEDDAAMRLVLPLDGESVYVSGQELVTTPYYYDWMRDLDARPDVSTRLIGHSVQGRPMFAATAGRQPETVILLGRQHPPEVTGALAMRTFVETVLGDGETARRFRERFRVVVIPLINPDGVALGHWRHNVNGVDLNRDWGPFSQPETRSIQRYLDALRQDGATFRLMLDFHSTRVNTFYTQLPEETPYAFDFATVWLDRSRQAAPGFEFRHDARAKSGLTNTKNYFFETYGIPAITYELGDETDRDAIADATPVFAEQMMRTLLEVGR